MPEAGEGVTLLSKHYGMYPRLAIVLYCTSYCHESTELILHHVMLDDLHRCTLTCVWCTVSTGHASKSLHWL